MRKIGVLGGTFDPLHNGHLMLAEQAMSALSLARVIFMPTGIPPHKDQSKLAPLPDRVEMVGRAIYGNEFFSLSTIESDTPGLSYTYNTLSMLTRQLEPDDEIFYIIGSDVLWYLPKFYKFDKLVRMCVFVVVTRAGAGFFPFDEHSQGFGVKRLADELAQEHGARIELLPFPEIGISSTLIRENIACGKSVRYMLPDTVSEYIRDKKLYQCREDTALLGYWDSIDPASPPRVEAKYKENCDSSSFNKLMDEISSDLCEQLSKRRFSHSVNVKDTATRLAGIYGADPKKSAIAGLLHDCARDIPPGRQMCLCEKWGIDISELEKGNPVLLHGCVGAWTARERYFISDPDIIDAILYHTTGCKDMGLLAKIVFIADAVEPGRKYEAAEAARQMIKMREPIDKVMLFLLDNQIRFVLERERTLQPNSIHARNSLLLVRQKED